MQNTAGMSLETRVRARLEKYRQDPEYQAGKLTLAVTEEISKVMIAKKVSRAELARRLGVSGARVTNLLKGNTNVTLKTLAAIGVALDCEFKVTFYEWSTPTIKGLAQWTEPSSGQVVRGNLKSVVTRSPLAVVRSQGNEVAA